MYLTKVFCVLSMCFLLSVCTVAQANRVDNDKTNDQKEDITSSFIFSFSALVTDVIDGCTIRVEIKEGRRGKIQDREFELASSNPNYKGIKIVKIVNTKCVSTDKTISYRAKEMLESSVKGKLVQVVFKTYADIKNSKMIGQIVKDDGNDVGLQQLKTGWVKFSDDKEETIVESDRGKYQNAEKNAKEQKIGLWIDQ